MLVSILQDSFAPGAVEENAGKIRDFYKKAAAQNADIALVPPEALCGFAPGSLLEYSEYSDRIARAQKKIVRETGDFTALVFDTPFAMDGSFSPMAALACNGCIRHAVSQFPEVDLKDSAVEFHGEKILLAYNSVSTAMQFEETDFGKKVDTVLLFDGRPFMLEEEEARCAMLGYMAGVVSNLVYVAQSGGRGKEVLTGASAIYTGGRLRLQMPYFETASALFDTKPPSSKKCASSLPDTEDKKIALIHDALVCGIRDYFKHNGIKKAVIGLSGGIDSAVVLPLAVEALGRQNVFGMMMPSQYSTDHSVNDAVQEAENLQIYYEIVPIEPLYNTFMKQLSPIFKGTPFGLAEENLQARIRGNLLMAAANKTGAMLLNTSNKSEAACGYGTMYGDLCGGMSVIGDLYKSQVYALARYINRKKEIIPQNCIDKAPSAELRPGQKDSDSLPPYDLIEKILRLHLEEKKDEKEIIKEGVDKEITRQVLGLFYKNAYKRCQTPPVIRVSNTVLAEDIEIPAAYKRSR